MSLEDFQLLDNEQFDNKIVKGDYLKTYHQQGAKLSYPDQNVEFIFGENNNNHQIGNAYLEFDITVRDTAGVFTNASNTRLINIALAYCFKELDWQRQEAQISNIINKLDSLVQSCVY